tara:strand:+ start:1830 stop:2228 length:399 start_codon:yes stop_codon:yes gene_type:complete
MKKVLLILLLLVGTTASGQDWVTDDGFDSAISGKSAFGEDQDIIVIEFYAEFNKDNAFADWNKLKGVKYYRCDIAKSPGAKKKYKVRMAPTLIVFKEGFKEFTYKAGLDLECPVTLEELQSDIEELSKASQF